MRLRELYHRGDENMPALYLIEYASEKAFFNKFETIKKYFFTAQCVSIEPASQIFPWEEDVHDEVFEGTWVACKSNKLIINNID